MDIPDVKFQNLTEAEVLTALADPHDEISQEVMRLSELRLKRLEGLMEKRGYIPPHLLHFKARWPIEAVAMRRVKIAVNDKY
jgi:hypothetical protein